MLGQPCGGLQLPLFFSVFYATRTAVTAGWVQTCSSSALQAVFVICATSGTEVADSTV
jgi:hypothetical protein